MHAVVRSYSGAGAKELMDVLEERKAEIESIVRAVTGFVAYSLIRTRDGGLSRARTRASRSPEIGYERTRPIWALAHWSRI